MKRNKPNPVFESSATQDFDYVDSQESLETLIDELLLEERIAVDTEFHREKTYYPSVALVQICLLYTSPSPRDVEESRMPSSA